MTVQCKARRYYESPSRQQKNEGEKIFPRFARRDRRYAPLYTAFGSIFGDAKGRVLALVDAIKQY